MIQFTGDKRILRILCALVALSLFMPSLTACSNTASEHKWLSVSDYLYLGKGSLYHSNSGNFRKTAESKNTRLYFDDKSMSIAVFDVLGNRAYYTLPGIDSQASILKITAKGENGTFELNSQDNSVAFGSAEYELTNSGVKITYTLSNDSITALKSPDKLINGELLVKVCINFMLSGDAVFTRIDCSDIYISEGYRITKLTVADDFGAVYKNDTDVLSALPENEQTTALPQTEETTENEEPHEEESEDNTQAEQSGSADIHIADRDFILLPDGCGALMYTDSTQENTNSLSFEVYGSDPGVGETDLLSASIPAYGMKTADTAFVSIIDNAAPLATITASRCADDNPNDADRVGVTFNITESITDNGKTYFAESYDGEILICTKFLSGNEATYTDMATACREELSRIGAISGQQIGSDSASLRLSFLVSSDGTDRNTVSSFRQIEDTLTLLKAKGVDKATLILRGALSGGLVRDDIDSFSILRSAGGKSDFESLYSYAKKQKFEVYVGCGILTQSTRANAVRAVDGSDIKTEIVNSLYPYSGKEFLSASLLSTNLISDKVTGLIDSAKGYSFDGYCISDAAAVLYTDGADRTKTAAALSNGVNAIATQKKLMLEGSFFTCLSRAQSLINIPFETQIPENDSYCAVPFLQTVLHSGVSYSGAPINKASIPTLLMLKYIEYGANLYFEWTFDSDNTLLYYDNSLSDAVEWYSDYENSLSDLSDNRIISHTAVDENVFCTGYDSGSLVYVNYNNYSVNIGNISVPAYGFFRVN